MKENQDAERITESAVLKINEANKIKELYRLMGNSGNGKENQLGEKQEVEEEWGEMGKLRDVNSADPKDQLPALRVMAKSNNKNLPRAGKRGNSRK